MTGLSLQGRSFPFSNGFLMLLVCLFYGELFRFNGEQQLPQAIYAAWGSYQPVKKGISFRQNAPEPFRKIYNASRRFKHMERFVFAPAVRSRGKNPLTSHAEEFLPALPRPPNSPAVAVTKQLID